jgi:hypothetical protein
VLKLRKGDGPKAILLVVLIAAAGWFIYRTLAQAMAPPGGAPAAQAGTPATPGATDQAQAQLPPAGEAMFAPRTSQVQAGLQRVATTPDPFRPYLWNLPPPARVPPTQPTKGPPVPPLPGVNPLPAPPPEVRLVGIVLAENPLAVLQEGDARMFARAGQLLPDGWRVLAVTARGVTLAQGKRRLDLRMTSRQEKGLRPLSPR